MGEARPGRRLADGPVLTSVSLASWPWYSNPNFQTYVGGVWAAPGGERALVSLVSACVEPSTRWCR